MANFLARSIAGDRLIRTKAAPAIWRHAMALAMLLLGLTFPQAPAVAADDVRPYLGVGLAEVVPAAAPALSVERGVVVLTIAQGSPAQRAGFRPMDVITMIDGQPVVVADDVSKAVIARLPGLAVTFNVVRNGKPFTLSATLAPAPVQPSPLDRSWIEGDCIPVQDDGPHVLAGAVLTTLTPAIAEPLGLGANSCGAAVKTVEPGSAAAQAGLQKGDAVFAVNGRRTPNAPIAADLFARATGASDQAVALLVSRGSNSAVVAIKSQAAVFLDKLNDAGTLCNVAAPSACLEGLKKVADAQTRSERMLAADALNKLSTEQSNMPMRIYALRVMSENDDDPARANLWKKSWLRAAWGPFSELEGSSWTMMEGSIQVVRTYRWNVLGESLNESHWQSYGKGKYDYTRTLIYNNKDNVFGYKTVGDYVGYVANPDMSRSQFYEKEFKNYRSVVNFPNGDQYEEVHGKLNKGQFQENKRTIWRRITSTEFAQLDQSRSERASNTGNLFGAVLSGVAQGLLGQSADGSMENPLDPNTVSNRRFDAMLERTRRDAIEADRRKAEQVAAERGERQQAEQTRLAEQIAATNRQREEVAARTNDPSLRAQLVQQRRNADDATLKAGLTAQVESATGRLAAVGINRAIPTPQAQPVAAASTTAAKGEVCIPPTQGVVPSRVFCEGRSPKESAAVGGLDRSGSGSNGKQIGGTGGSTDTSDRTIGGGSPVAPGKITPPQQANPTYIWKEAIAVCTVSAKGKLDMCYGPRSAGVYGSEQERLDTAGCRRARGLGTQGQYRIFGCDYGINPRANERNYAQAHHWDQIVRRGLSEPAGRQEYRCKSQFEYCQNRAD